MRPFLLFATTKDQLEYLRFPLGSLNKTETRKIAERLNLKVKNKPDSQDICFVPNGKYSDVVRRLRPGAIEPGNITYLDGSVLGRHNGIIDYTIGQRRGLGIGGVSDLEEERLYVVDINVQDNEVVVGPKEALNVDEMKKYPFSRLSGPANVLVVPARHSASISVKLLQEMGGATVIGPILTGIDKPIQICSTVSAVSDILNMAVIAACNIR